MRHLCNDGPGKDEALGLVTQGTVALQLLRYHIVRLKGYPIDQPRNLAKSVMVE